MDLFEFRPFFSADFNFSGIVCRPTQNEIETTARSTKIHAEIVEGTRTSRPEDPD
jgi:hypothetical protein